MPGKVLSCALLLALSACDGPFEIRGGATPGDPFSGSDFALDDETRTDLVSVEAACVQYCDVQLECDGRETTECVRDCLSPALVNDFAAAPQSGDADCSAAFGAAVECVSGQDCDAPADCDEIVADYISCTFAE